MKRKTLEIPTPKKGEPLRAILYIDDELSFINAAQVKDDIVSRLKEFDELLVQANLAHLDLTGVQLLYSIQKTCKTLNKRVIYNVKLNDDLKNLISKSGFKELFN